MSGRKVRGDLAGALWRASAGSAGQALTIFHLGERATVDRLGDAVALVTDGAIWMAYDSRVSDVERALLVADERACAVTWGGPVFVEDTRREPRSARLARLAAERAEVKAG